jgi:hypothetical protein
MTDPMHAFCRALERELPPEYVVSVRPYRCMDDASITHFINILMVPNDRLHSVVWRAWELADSIYGDEPVRFLMATVNPESSEKYFAKELGKARGRWIQTSLRLPLVAGTFRSLVYPAMECASISVVAKSTAEATRWLEDAGWPDIPSKGNGNPGIGPTLRAVEMMRPEDPVERRYPYAA